MQESFAQHMTWQENVVTSPHHYLTALPAPGVMVTSQGVISVPVVIREDCWYVQGAPPPDPLRFVHPHYVPFQPQLRIDDGRLNMNDVTNALPMRPILVPGRPSFGVRFPAERTLRGHLAATRRPSVESTSDAPTKKVSLANESTSKDNASNGVEGSDRIQSIVESCFSDEGLARNNYLLKLITQHKDGYVSLKRISAIKRIKALTNDEHVVVQSVLKSNLLEMNLERTMIRRICPLPPALDQPKFIRSVIAINLPMKIPTIESVTSLFMSYGDLTQVRVLKPGRPIPTFLREYQSWVPDLGRNYCALVEFESQDEAQKACREINITNRTNASLRVALLKPGARLRRTLYRKYKGNEETANHLSPLTPLSDLKSKSFPDQCRDFNVSESGSESEVTSPSKSNLIPQTQSSASDAEYEITWSEVGVQQSKELNRQTTLRDFSIKNNAFQQVVSNGLSVIEILRQPTGPKDNTSKGFQTGFRHMT